MNMEWTRTGFWKLHLTYFRALVLDVISVHLVLVIQRYY